MEINTGRKIALTTAQLADLGNRYKNAPKESIINVQVRDLEENKPFTEPVQNEVTENLFDTVSPFEASIEAPTSESAVGDEVIKEEPKEQNAFDVNNIFDVTSTFSAPVSEPVNPVNVQENLQDVSTNLFDGPSPAVTDLNPSDTPYQEDAKEEVVTLEEIKKVREEISIRLNNLNYDTIKLNNLYEHYEHITDVYQRQQEMSGKNVTLENNMVQNQVINTTDNSVVAPVNNGVPNTSFTPAFDENVNIFDGPSSFTM